MSIEITDTIRFLTSHLSLTPNYHDITKHLTVSLFSARHVAQYTYMKSDIKVKTCNPCNEKKNEASFVRICLHNSSNENAVVVSVQKKCSTRIASAQRGFERMSSFLAQFPYFHTFTKRGHIVADESHAACYLRTLNNGTNNNCRRSPEGRKQRAIERDTLEAVKIALFSDSQFVIVCVCLCMLSFVVRFSLSSVLCSMLECS